MQQTDRSGHLPMSPSLTNPAHIHAAALEVVLTECRPGEGGREPMKGQAPSSLWMHFCAVFSQSSPGFSMRLRDLEKVGIHGSPTSRSSCLHTGLQTQHLWEPCLTGFLGTIRFPGTYRA